MDVEPSCPRAEPPALPNNTSVAMSDSMETEEIQAETIPTAEQSSTYADYIEEAGEEVVMDDAEDLQVVPDTPATLLVSQPNSISAVLFFSLHA
jgi:hypothetical protein